ncbi:MAG: hypothetical protein PHW62_00445 [Candidatus Ratteibacteria bacterium]|nr:hypothetical protein [Candidatus Ratteibacteria bacterium]
MEVQKRIMTGKLTPERIKGLLEDMNLLQRQKEKELKIINATIWHIQTRCPHILEKDQKACKICGIQFENNLQIYAKKKEYEEKIVKQETASKYGIMTITSYDDILIVQEK